MKEIDQTFNIDNINKIEFKLLNEQVNLILRALELYAYNLEYMLDGSELENDTKQEKLAMYKYTYEQILSYQAEQVNGKSKAKDTISILSQNMLKNNNLFNIIPSDKNANAG